MEEEPKQDTHSIFKEKFKQNPLDPELSIQQLLKTTLHKKHSRDLLRKLEEKNDIVGKVNRVSPEKRETDSSAVVDIKTIEQLLTINKGIACIDYKMNKTLRNLLKTQPLPEHLRKDIWMLASGARAKMNQNPEYYNRIQELLAEYPTVFLKAIDLDLKRTFPEKTYDPNDPEVVKMRRILSAYAKRNPAVGYCQGFNFIMSKLINMIDNEEEAFWLFVILVEDILPTDYFTWMIGVLVDLEILTEIVYLFRPELESKFQELSVHPGQLYSLQWLICLFTSVYPDTIVKIIWDFLFVDGTRVMFKAALILYEKCAKEIATVSEFYEVLPIFEEGSKQEWDPVQFCESLKQVYISKKMLRFLRERMKKKVKGDLDQVEIKNPQRPESSVNKIIQRDDTLVCDLKWPVCMDYIETAKQKKRINSFFVYRATQLPLTIEHNYFKCEIKQNITNQRRLTTDNSARSTKSRDSRAPTPFIQPQGYDREDQKTGPAKNTPADKTAAQNSMVIGRHNHTCIKKNRRPTNAADVVSKVQSQFSKLATFNDIFDGGNSEDPMSAANPQNRRISGVTQRPKSNSVFGYLSGMSSLKEPSRVWGGGDDHLQHLHLQHKIEKLDTEIDPAASALTNKGMIISYGSSSEDSDDDDDEEHKDEYTIISKRDTVTTNTTKNMSTVGDEEDDEDFADGVYTLEPGVNTFVNPSRSASEDTDSKPNSQPRLSIINYLKEREKLSSTFNADFMSKSTKFLNEYLDKNSLI